jgi:hypothetical protein
MERSIFRVQTSLGVAHMPIIVLGVRHHGPGSARSVIAALERLQPDVILVEGPPDAQALLPLLNDPHMHPPIALLIYPEVNPGEAVYYPFTQFSPEYQAILYGLRHNIPIRMMDLSLRYQLAVERDVRDVLHDHALIDPLAELARAAGYDDAERWWDVMIEQTTHHGRDSVEVFDVILEAMTTLREVFPNSSAINSLREATMRHTIHHAEQDGFRNIAVVCGAWHAPALHNAAFTDEDAQLLENLPEVNLAATWIPWSFTHLSRQSGYGAGITAPAWYRFLWEHPDAQHLAGNWLTLVAQHLRKEGLIASPAQVIDAVQLAETLATLRDRQLPDLHDLLEAALSVLCHGNEAPMQLIHRDLIMGHEIGQVPSTTPMIPLHKDLLAEAARLGLAFSEEEQVLDLDQREERDREISHLLYRLQLLNIPWGSCEESEFLSEVWVLRWDTTTIICLIERGVWGNNVHDAAANYALDLAQKVSALPQLSELIEMVLFAHLPRAIPDVVRRLENEASTTGDILQLMNALPPLTNSVVYGDVRQTPLSSLRVVALSMVTRIMIRLPKEYSNLDDAAAESRLETLSACDRAIRLLNESDHLTEWHAVLTRMCDQDSVHGLLRGRMCRILIDAGVLSQVDGARRMRLALDRVVAPETAAAWLHGFLQDSGTAVVHDEDLLHLLDEWVKALTVEDFERILPLLRRTAATFEDPEIRHIGRRVQNKPLPTPKKQSVQTDPARASQVDKTLDDILGLGSIGG